MKTNFNEVNSKNLDEIIRYLSKKGLKIGTIANTIGVKDYEITKARKEGKEGNTKKLLEIYPAILKHYAEIVSDLADGSIDYDTFKADRQVLEENTDALCGISKNVLEIKHSVEDIKGSLDSQKDEIEIMRHEIKLLTALLKKSEKQHLTHAR